MFWVKGVFLGVSLFGIGVAIFLIRFLRMSGPLLSPPGQAVSYDIRTIAFVTTHNPWFWIGAISCVGLGLAIVASWPGRIWTTFWVLLALADAVLAGMLAIFIL